MAIMELGEFCRNLSLKLPETQTGVCFLAALPGSGCTKNTAYARMASLLSLVTCMDIGTILEKLELLGKGLGKDFSFMGNSGDATILRDTLRGWYDTGTDKNGKPKHNNLSQRHANLLLGLCADDERAKKSRKSIEERLKFCEQARPGFVSALSSKLGINHTTETVSDFAENIREEFCDIINYLASSAKPKNIWQNTVWGKQFLLRKAQVLGNRMTEPSLFPSIQSAKGAISHEVLVAEILEKSISLITAYPGMGKSHLAFWLGEQAADRDTSVFYLSLSGNHQNILLEATGKMDYAQRSLIILDDTNQSDLPLRELLRQIRTADKSLHFLLLQQCDDLTTAYEDSLRRKFLNVYTLELLSRDIIGKILAPIPQNPWLFPIISVPAYMDMYISFTSKPKDPYELIDHIIRSKVACLEIEFRDVAKAAVEDTENLILEKFLKFEDFLITGKQRGILLDMGLVAYSGRISHDFFGSYFLAKALSKRLKDKYVDRDDIARYLNHLLPVDVIRYLSIILSEDEICRMIDQLRKVKHDDNNQGGETDDLSCAVANLLYIDAAQSGGEVKVSLEGLDLSATKLYQLRLNALSVYDAKFSYTNLLDKDIHRSIIDRLLPVDATLLFSLGRGYARLWELKDGQLVIKTAIDYDNDYRASPDDSMHIRLSKNAPNGGKKTDICGKHSFEIQQDCSWKSIVYIDGIRLTLSYGFPIKDICFMKNGRYLVASTSDRDIHLVDCEKKCVVQRISGCNSGLRCIRQLSNTNHYLAIAYDGTALELDENYHATARYPLGKWPWQVVRLNDNEFAVACMTETIVIDRNTMKLTGKRLPVLAKSHTKEPKVWDLFCDSNTSRLWICENDCIRVFDNDLSTELSTYEFHDYSPKCILLVNGNMFVGTSDGKILRLDKNQWDTFVDLDPRVRKIQKLIALDDEHLLVVGSHMCGGGGYAVLNINNGRLLPGGDELVSTYDEEPSFGTAAAYDKRTGIGVWGDNLGRIYCFKFVNGTFTVKKYESDKEPKLPVDYYICDCLICSDGSMLFACLNGRLFKLTIDSESSPEEVFRNVADFNIFGCSFTERSIKETNHTDMKQILRYFNNTIM